MEGQYEKRNFLLEKQFITPYINDKPLEILGPLCRIGKKINSGFGKLSTAIGTAVWKFAESQTINWLKLKKKKIVMLMKSEKSLQLKVYKTPAIQPPCWYLTSWTPIWFRHFYVYFVKSTSSYRWTLFFSWALVLRLIVQINNFQKVSFDYHLIRDFVQKFYRAELSCILFANTPQ